MRSATCFKKSAVRQAVLLALSLNGAALTLGAGDAQAAQSACATLSSYDTNSANFTMLSSTGGVVGGTNDVVGHWDGTVYTDSSDYIGPGLQTANMTAHQASTTGFFGHTWTAHDIQVFAPGTYTFDTTLGGGNAESGLMTMNVPAGELGMHMLFDWNGNNNIDVSVVGKPSSIFGAGLVYSTVTNTKGQFKCDAGFTGTITQNCLYDGAQYGGTVPVKNQVWQLVSTINANSVNGVAGIPMATGGPFAGFNANFNFNFGSAISYQAGTPCSAAVPTLTPSTFTPVTGATPGTQYTSNSIAVSGLGTGVTAKVTVSGGQYSKDGGTTWSSAAGTAKDGDTFIVRQTSWANPDGTTTSTNLNIGGVPATFNVTVINEKPASFSFTTQTGVATSALIDSNTITVSGMDNGVTTPISISGGQYSVNGATFSTTTPATVKNGDTITVQVLSAATGASTTIATLTLGQAANGTAVSGTFTVTTTGGVTSSGNNFTMLDSRGNITGGTNDVVMTWDQKFNTSTSDPVTPATAHMRLSSVTPFFSHNWTAHHISVFGPGTYTINVDCTVPQWESGTCTPNANPARNYSFTVGANQIAAHMLFDWNGTLNIDVVDIWNQKVVFGPSALYTGGVGFNSATTQWDLMSSDANVSCPGAVDATGAPINCGINGINGVPMIDGPFLGFSANFNINFVGTTGSSSNNTPTVKVGDPSNAPGCSISARPSNDLERGDWWLVAGFLAWLGAIRLRCKRQIRS